MSPTAITFEAHHKTRWCKPPAKATVRFSSKSEPALPLYLFGTIHRHLDRTITHGRALQSGVLQAGYTEAES